MSNAIVLLSGGLDSSTCVALAKQQGHCVYALSVDYGQRHVSELQAAKRIASYFEVTHQIVTFGLGQLGGSSLTDPKIAVPAYTGVDVIENTYVPARNTAFLSLALGWAEVVGARHIYVGATKIDYGRYPDCRPEYFQAFEQMARLATRCGVEGDPIQIHTPLIDCDKAKTIQMGIAAGIDYGLTVSCYAADAYGAACGVCDSCVLRAQAFKAAGIADPTRYQS